MLEENNGNFDRIRFLNPSRELKHEFRNPKLGKKITRERQKQVAQLRQELKNNFPHSRIPLIAITGSVALGLPDHFSDLDLAIHFFKGEPDEEILKFINKYEIKTGFDQRLNIQAFIV